MKKRTIELRIDVDEDTGTVNVEIMGDASKDKDLIASMLLDAATKVRNLDPLYVEWKEV
jgi:hypothetical protein